MIRGIRAAVAFMTRLPVAGKAGFSPREVSSSMRWFPLAGALIGAFYAGGAILFGRVFPPFVAAALVLVIEALLTGAIHMDGLADTADGFGGGHTRDDVLRIMRDHAIGAYGSVALLLLAALKISAIAALIQLPAGWTYILIAPAVGRWTPVLLGSALPYARTTDPKGTASAGSVSSRVGRSEVIVSSVIALGFAVGIARWHGAIAIVLALGFTAMWGWYCRRQIGGNTGDTLGSCVEIVETIILLLGLVRI
jgi:cobalamin 5'-phosphate synthase/cobalamin synthase